MIIDSWHTHLLRLVYTLHERDQHRPWKPTPESRGRRVSVPMRTKSSLISAVAVALDGSRPTAAIAVKKE